MVKSNLALAARSDSSTIPAMPRPPKLTDVQRTRLGELEPRLRLAVGRGDYPAAKRITGQIQTILRPTGHETRLQQAKNWLWEAAMEAADYRTAESGFIGVRQMVTSETRVYLEATALLAVCYIRQRKIDDAKQYMTETLVRLRNISSPGKRERFRVKVIERFEQESVLAGLYGLGRDSLNADEIERMTAVLVAKSNEQQILRSLGQVVPAERMELLEIVRKHTRKQLTADERKALPSPESMRRAVHHGETIFGALKRVVWRAVCDPESDLYRTWWTNGIQAVITDKKTLYVTIAATLASQSIANVAIAAYLSALMLKMGLELYCERTKPEPIMAERQR